MAEQEAEKKVDEEVKEQRFSFPPGSSQKSIERNINARRRKAPIDGVTPTLTSPAAFPENYGIKIVRADEIFPERCHRKVYPSGAKRKPHVGFPESWMNSLGVDWMHKENGNDDVTLEISEDRQEIRIRKTPAPPTMQENVDARIFAADSDAAAELDELRKNQEK
jgi:hypothetical protein